MLSVAADIEEPHSTRGQSRVFPDLNMMIFQPTSTVATAEGSSGRVADAATSQARNVVASLAGKTLEEIERQAILDTLVACRGNKAKSARMLGISEKSIYNKMRRLGLPLAVHV